MAAAQPFLSGAISKTVNLPADATVADVAKVEDQENIKNCTSIAGEILSTHGSEAAMAADQAKRAGYTGESCSSCGSIRVLRNCTCVVCDDCGTTSGCS